MNKEIAKKIVRRIVDDINDRYSLSEEWNNISVDTRELIEREWETIIMIRGKASASKEVKEGDTVMCKCGHEAIYGGEASIYGVAKKGGMEFWGDICEECFSCGPFNIVESDGHVANWELASIVEPSPPLRTQECFMIECSTIRALNSRIKDYLSEGYKVTNSGMLPDYGAWATLEKDK